MIFTQVLDEQREMREYPERPAPIAVLRSSTVLNGVTEADLMFLAEQSHPAYAERGEVIWMSGGQLSFFGVVGIGFVKMVRTQATGQEITAEIMGPGQVFGMLGTIDGAGCPLSARAVCNTWYLKVPKSPFLEVYSHTEALKDHVVRRTTLRLRQAYEMMARMSSGKVEQRIAAVLVILAESYGRETDQGTLIDVPLTRQDVAEMAGTTAETTIRAMSRWQKDGVLELSRRKIVVVDLDALGEVLAF